VSRRHTSGFDILGMDRDPTPGDPDRIDELARFYEEIRDDAQTGVRVLGRGGSLSRARGASMEKLRDMLDTLPRKLQQTVDSFDTAAQAYRAYARVLRDQQTRIDTAMDQALETVPAARRVAPRASPDATTDQIAEVRAATDDIAGARARLSAAQRLAADARRLREAASARCRGALDDAADKAIKPPPRRNFFQRIGDFFRNNPIFRLIIDIVIAVVGVVLPVVGIVLAAVALVVTVAVQAANGNFELGTLLVGLVTLVPGAKLLGPLVRGAKSVAPGLVRTVGSGAQAFGRIGRNNTVIKGGLSFGGRTGSLGSQAVAEFGKGVVEEVATVGLNKLGNPNSEGFNLASIAGGAAAGAAFGTAFDGFRKGSGDGLDLDARPAGSTGTTPGGETPNSAGSSFDTSPSTSGAEASSQRLSTDTSTTASSGTDAASAGTTSPATDSSAPPTSDTAPATTAPPSAAGAPNAAPASDPGPVADGGSATSSGNSAVVGAPPIAPAPAPAPGDDGVPGVSAVPSGAGAATGGTGAASGPASPPPAPGDGDLPAPARSVDGPAATGEQPNPATATVAPTAAAQGDTTPPPLPPPPLPPLPPPTALGSIDGREAPRSQPNPDRPDTSEAGSTTDTVSDETADDPIAERTAEALNAAGSGLAGDAASGAIEDRQGEEPEPLSGIGHGFVLDEGETGFTKRTRR
jgi:hypothetical protein